MQRLPEQAINTDFADLNHETYEPQEQGHGRQEHRTCDVIEIPQDHPQRSIWKGLTALIILTCCRLIGSKESWQTRLYISSHQSNAKRLATAIRRHWSIENSQHWVLDVTFGEDEQRQQDRNGAANLAAIRRLAVSRLRQKKPTNAE